MLEVSVVGNYYHKDTACEDVLNYKSDPRDIGTTLERIYTFDTPIKTAELLLLAQWAGFLFPVKQTAWPLSWK